jgi:hypothetical protein
VLRDPPPIAVAETDRDVLPRPPVAARSITLREEELVQGRRRPQAPKDIGEVLTQLGLAGELTQHLRLAAKLLLEEVAGDLETSVVGDRERLRPAPTSVSVVGAGD